MNEMCFVQRKSVANRTMKLDKLPKKLQEDVDFLSEAILINPAYYVQLESQELKSNRKIVFSLVISMLREAKITDFHRELIQNFDGEIKKHLKKI